MKQQETGKTRLSKTAMPRISRQFLRAADEGYKGFMDRYIEAGLPLNVAEPGSGQTALHIAAAGGARACVRALTASGRVDYLVRDAQGRLPSELAGVIADDPLLAQELREKERAQAKAQGQSWTRRPR